MRLLSDLRAFAVLVWKDWLSLMTGLFSLVLTALGSSFTGFPAWSFWVAAMLALFVSMFRAWQREHHGREEDQAGHAAEAEERARSYEAQMASLREQVAANDLAARRLACRRAVIDQLKSAERVVLNCILRSGPMTGNAITAECNRTNVAYVDMNALRAYGIVYQEADGRWGITETWTQPLRECIHDL
jgi:hypothetical protein